MSFDQPYPQEQGNVVSPQLPPADFDGLMSRVDGLQSSLEQHVSEFQRFQKFFAQQMETHATNTNAAFEKHAAASNAFNDMKASFDSIKKGLVADVQAIKGKLSTLA